MDDADTGESIGSDEAHVESSQWHEMIWVTPVLERKK